jgi:hypothetical protein
MTASAPKISRLLRAFASWRIDATRSRDEIGALIASSKPRGPTQLAGYVARWGELHDFPTTRGVPLATDGTG